MKTKFLKTYFIVILVSLFVIIFDMLTKYLLIGSLIPNEGDSVDFIKGFINFVHVQNEGASWGIFKGQTIFLIIISLVILGVVVWFYVKKVKEEKVSILLSFVVGFLVGGCVGNLYDRIVFGYVRDFINFEFISFPVFNIADCAITIGVILLVLYFVLDYIKFIKSEKKKIKEIKLEEIDKTKEAEQFNDELGKIIQKSRKDKASSSGQKSKADEKENSK